MENQWPMIIMFITIAMMKSSRTAAITLESVPAPGRRRKSGGLRVSQSPSTASLLRQKWHRFLGRYGWLRQCFCVWRLDTSLSCSLEVMCHVVSWAVAIGWNVKLYSDFSSAWITQAGLMVRQRLGEVDRKWTMMGNGRHDWISYVLIYFDDAFNGLVERNIYRKPWIFHGCPIKYWGFLYMLPFPQAIDSCSWRRRFIAWISWFWKSGTVGNPGWEDISWGCFRCFGRIQLIVGDRYLIPQQKYI